MRCKLCGKINITGSIHTAHSWIVSQHCNSCHFLKIKNGGKDRFVP